MPGKNRLNVIIDDEAKEVVVDYQTEKKYDTRDDAVENLLKDYPKLKAQIKELEDEIQKLRGKK